MGTSKQISVFIGYEILGVPHSKPSLRAPVPANASGILCVNRSINLSIDVFSFQNCYNIQTQRNCIVRHIQKSLSSQIVEFGQMTKGGITNMFLVSVKSDSQIRVGRLA